MFEYKTVPAPAMLLAVHRKQFEEEIRNFSQYINKECVDGWEFQSLESISITEAPGCMALFGKKETVTYHMMIFRREKNAV